MLYFVGGLVIAYGLFLVWATVTRGYPLRMRVGRRGEAKRLLYQLILRGLGFVLIGSQLILAQYAVSYGRPFPWLPAVIGAALVLVGDIWRRTSPGKSQRTGG